jgi:flagellar biosynthesis protein FlhG
MGSMEEPKNVIDFVHARARATDARREGLRAVTTPPGLTRRTRAKKIIAVGGGKGGVGKTMLSANLGIALASAGRKVVLVDADLGGANLHTALGVKPPKLTLSDFVQRRAASLEELLVPAGVENLSLVAGAQDVLEAAHPKWQQKQRLLRHLQMLDVDYVILDLAAGTSFNVLDFFLIADHGMLVVLPEPTSVENAYRFVKASFFRKLQHLGESFGFSEAVDQVMSTVEGSLRTPFDFVARLRQERPELGDVLTRELQRFRIRLVVNQARTPADQQVGQAVVAAWKKFFGLEMDWLGSISYADEAWKAVRKRRPLLLESGHSEAAAGVLAVAKNLLAMDGRTP